jgi:amino acid adenylation domain-containing protein
MVGASWPRGHLLEINGLVAAGRLQLAWSYNPAVHSAARVAGWAEGYLEALRELIAHCTAPGTWGRTPSDFPLAQLAQGQLDRLLAGRRGIEDVYPLSPLQHGLLFHTLHETQAGAYFVQIGLGLEGAAEPERLRLAWQAVVDRHSALRSGFVLDDPERAVQLVHVAAELPWQVLDWRSDDAAGQASRWQALLAADQAAGFVLAQPPLLRCTLVRLGEQRWRLLFSNHHALLDGWCLPILFREVLAGYEAGRRGAALRLAAARPYRDFIAWLQRQDRAGAEQFWREELGDFDAPTPIGIGRPAGAAANANDKQVLQLSEAVSAALTGFARRHRVTLNTLFQAAWAALLHRYSGERDIVFGATSSGRPSDLEGVEEAIGLFIRTLPVRVRLDDAEPALALLTRLQEHQIAREQHGHVGLTEIQGWSGVPRGTPLFENLFVYENYPYSTATADTGLVVTDLESDDQTHYQLWLAGIPGERIAFRLSYDRGRFDAAEMARLLGHFQALLEGIVADPDRPVSALPLLTESERRQLEEWNATARAYPAERCIHELFEEQARQRPAAVAVEFEGERLSYGALERRANQLAHHLRGLGVGPETLVGLCVERSVEMVVGLLGILKAGGAYVPLDPEYPEQRLAFMLQDAQVRVVVAHAQTRARLGGSPARLVCLDSDRARLDGEAETAPASWAGPDNAAYVIYTSGSTGQPKGVVVEHRNVVRLVCGTDYVELGPDMVLLQLAPLAFDASTFEIWGALLQGGRLVMAPPGRLALEDLAALLACSGVNTLWLTSGLFHLMVDRQPEGLRGLRQLLAGGDVLSAEHVRRVLDGLPGLQVINGYGPTEATTFSCCYRVPAKGWDGTMVPIGRPIANTRAYVLDDRGGLVPVGVAGELYIGGAGVARGYLNRPALTAERFVLDPFSEEPGARLYRTGDLCRWRADGTLEFLSRRDEQVKIRGFRIEPGEIEAVLTRHPAVRDGAVLAREGAGGDRRLVAYVVSEGGEGAELRDELRAHLRRSLPEHMVPGQIVFLPALPLSANGKLDRRALPEPEAPPSAATYVAPRDPTEEILAGIWAEVLGVERVSIHDNFFDLGGHSLLATQVVSRVREAFDRRIELPIRVLFEATNIADLARAVQILDSRELDLPLNVQDVEEGEL